MAIRPPFFLALLVLVVVACACAVRPSPPVSGVLRGEQVWRGTVRLAGDVELVEGARLTILPGTEVLFLSAADGEDRFTDHPHFPGSELIVRGTISAEGTPRSPITFRFADPDAPPGSWGGVNLVASPHASFRYCRFTQADSALHSQGSRVLVEQSLFEENRVGVRFHSSEIRIERNLFRRNGAAIRFHFGAPVIRGNEIRENGKGIFITSFPTDYLIEGNNIVGQREAAVVLGEEVPEDVGMAGNFWGTREADAIEAAFFDGRRVSYLGRILYRPHAASPLPDAGTSWTP